jgi:hypothetical protein
MPSCPFEFAPQHMTRPPVTITQVWYPPTLIEVAETPVYNEKHDKVKNEDHWV